MKEVIEILRLAIGSFLFSGLVSALFVLSFLLVR